MEEIIELIINMIGRWIADSRKPPQPMPRSAPQFQGAPPPRAPEAPRQVISNRAVVTAKMPGAARRKVGRRSNPTSVAVARPILTGDPAKAPPMKPVAPAKPITATSHEGSSKATPPISAAAIRKWLTPATLRKQFILTEIMHPPLALRDPQHSN